MSKNGSRDNLGGKNRSQGSQAKGAKGVRDLADKLEEDFKESKLEDASGIVERIEKLKDMAVDGQVKPLQQLKDVMKNWREILDSAPDKSDELATGDMAVCSSWYAPKVEVKLKDLLDEFRDIDSAVSQIKAEKFQELGRRMSKAMDRITPTVYGMKRLPAEVNNVAEKADEREDTLKDADTKAMKKSLDSQDMNSSLSDLAGCQPKLLDLVEPTQMNLEKVQQFLQEAHSKFKQAFEVPCPCCCMTPYVYDQPSRCLMELLENADRALEIDLQPLQELLGGLKDFFYDLDTSRISKPTKKFSALASERVDRLDKIVAGARPSGSYCLMPMGNSRRRQ